MDILVTTPNNHLIHIDPAEPCEFFIVHNGDIYIVVLRVVDYLGTYSMYLDIRSRYGVEKINRSTWHPAYIGPEIETALKEYFV